MMAIILKLYVAIFLTLFTSKLCVSVKLPVKRSLSEPIKDCNQYSLPCGWGAYEQSTKKITSYWQNKCKCRAYQKCVQSSDDVYVYNCK